MRIDYDSSEEVRTALAAIGRTEDVLFSPDGTRLAIAGFEKNRVLILTLEDYDGQAAVPRICFSTALTLQSPSFANPHGLAWLDDETLLIANRNGQVPLIRVPKTTNASELHVRPVHSLGKSEGDLISTPGSVSATLLQDDLAEVLVCNNFAHYVTRHILDRRQGWGVLASERVLSDRLNVPDGVTHSLSGRWVAVSNHYDNSVFIYEADQLGTSDRPACVLRGAAFPHGLRFTPDDRALLVADAGLPLVHVFVAPDGNWSGVVLPSASIQVIDDATFKASHFSDEEGGPKGLALTPDGALFCITCEQEPLVFFDVRPTLAKVGLTPAKPVAAGVVRSLSTRALLARALTDARERYDAALQRAAAAERRAQEVEAAAAAISRELQNLVNSTSWKATGPLWSILNRWRRRG